MAEGGGGRKHDFPFVIDSPKSEYSFSLCIQHYTPKEPPPIKDQASVFLTLSNPIPRNCDESIGGRGDRNGIEGEIKK